MTSRAARELNVGLSVLAAVLVLTALVAIHVVERMRPAITQVLDDNVASLHASSEMLAMLAAQRLPEPTAGAARLRFSEALLAASHNLTESGEAEALVELRELSAAALAGERRALERTLAALASLERANLAATRAASENAQRLGTAGAWALALLGLLGFAAGSLVRRRLQRRVAAPFLELERVLLSVDGGDKLRRCASTGHSASQQHVLRALNRLLDTAETHSAKPSAAITPAELVPWLLDASSQALALLDAHGEVVSASQSVLEMLADEHGGELLGRFQRAAGGSNEEHVTLVRRSERFTLLALSAAPGG
jgi:PAS domain-containing protein